MSSSTTTFSSSILLDPLLAAHHIDFTRGLLHDLATALRFEHCKTRQRELKRIHKSFLHLTGIDLRMDKQLMPSMEINSIQCSIPRDMLETVRRRNGDWVCKWKWYNDYINGEEGGGGSDVQVELELELFMPVQWERWFASLLALDGLEFWRDGVPGGQGVVNMPKCLVRGDFKFGVKPLIPLDPEGAEREVMKKRRKAKGKGNMRDREEKQKGKGKDPLMSQLNSAMPQVGNTDVCDGNILTALGIRWAGWGLLGKGDLPMELPGSKNSNFNSRTGSWPSDNSSGQSPSSPSLSFSSSSTPPTSWLPRAPRPSPQAYPIHHQPTISALSYHYPLSPSSLCPGCIYHLHHPSTRSPHSKWPNSPHRVACRPGPSGYNSSFSSSPSLFSSASTTGPNISSSTPRGATIERICSVDHSDSQPSSSSDQDTGNQVSEYVGSTQGESENGSRLESRRGKGLWLVTLPEPSLIEELMRVRKVKREMSGWAPGLASWKSGGDNRERETDGQEKEAGKGRKRVRK